MYRLATCFGSLVSHVLMNTMKCAASLLIKLGISCSSQNSFYRVTWLKLLQAVSLCQLQTIIKLCSNNVLWTYVFILKHMLQNLQREVTMDKCTKVHIPDKTGIFWHVFTEYKLTAFSFTADDAFPLNNHVIEPHPGNQEAGYRIFNYQLS